jgi:hypothetical protein
MTFSCFCIPGKQTKYFELNGSMHSRNFNSSFPRASNTPFNPSLTQWTRPNSPPILLRVARAQDTDSAGCDILEHHNLNIRHNESFRPITFSSSKALLKFEDPL